MRMHCWGICEIFQPTEAFPKAQAAANRALTLDSTLAEAHAALGFVYWVNADFVGAERAFRRSIELNPNLAIAHERYHGFLKSLGKFKEAQEELTRARALDPLSLVIGIGEADVWFYQRDYDRAMIHFKKLLELDPNYSPAHLWLASVYAHKGLFDQEADEIETSLKLDGLPDVAAALRRAYTESGTKGLLLKDIELRSNPANKPYIGLYSWRRTMRGWATKITPSFGWNGRGPSVQAGHF